MSMREHSRKYVVKRATESGVALDKLALDLENVYNKPADQVVEVAVIWDGALDEDFYMDRLYAVNVADWLAEECANESEADPDHPSWEVLVTEYVPDDAGSQVYVTRSENTLRAPDCGDPGPDCIEHEGKCD